MANRHCNPTVFVVTDIRDPRLMPDTRARLDVARFALERFGQIYGSYYRPGEIWESEVFVCPHCHHSTLIEHCNDDSMPEMFHCKYCYSDWRMKDGRLWMLWSHPDDGEGEYRLI